ncbi:MAG: type II toxin-antitoxin system HicA family toxin [Spirochaetaceae bacterium]|nr:type II toxin-antitoxin system HicA family toxin [Spirochaetaceae bacterium]
MSKKEKLIQRLQTRPNNFSFDELVTLMGHYGYYLIGSGKTGGSRIAFGKDDDYIRLHRPHPHNILKLYQVDNILEALNERGLI